MSMTPPSAPPPSTAPAAPSNPALDGQAPVSPAPTSPPPSTPPPLPGGRRPGQQQWLLLLVGGAAIVGLIIAGGSLFSRIDREGTSFRYGWPFLLIGTAVGFGVGAIILVAARQAGLRPTRIELITVLVVCAAVGALLGLAFAPPKVDAEDVSPITKEEQQRRVEQYGDLPDGAQAGPIDRDGDGLPDLDENGDPIIGLDTDGDGVIDSYLQRCPEGSPPPIWPNGEAPIEVAFRPATSPDPVPPEDGEIIDAECDGTIDAVIPYSDKFLTPPGGDSGAAPPIEPPSGPPSTISPEERADQADQRSAPSSGQMLRFLGIALAIAALVGLVAWLAVQWRGRAGDDEDDTPDEPKLDLPPPETNPNFQRSIDEMIEDPDPRNGILAAYGRLLIGFDEIGLGRLPHEGPQEHLDRALAASTTDSAAAKELTEWFTRARFSSHPISEDDRRRAVDALRKVTASMRPLPATTEPAPATR